MRTNRLTGIIFISILFSVLFYTPSSASSGGENIDIPGDISRLCYYSNFFYNFPSGDFLYYLNDRLLFSEKPDEMIIEKGLRDKLLEVVSWHQVIEEFLFNQNQGKVDGASFSLKDPDELRKAYDLLSLLGQYLKKNKKGQYYLARKSTAGVANYLRFALIRPRMLELQMNRTQSFHFHLKKSSLSLPPGLSLEFIREVSGTAVNASSFFELLLKNERLSLLMGVLYRLSNNEIDYIDNLVQTPNHRHGAWKKIYNDKKLLMGLFVLSNALRVKPGTNRLALPGGEAAASFWSEMAADPANPTPLNPASFEFLQSLAGKDDGKLNYLYIFSYFLPADKLKTLFFDFDAQKMKEIYDLISLKEEEKINPSAFPRLDDWSFFTLLYALKTKNGAIDLPRGVDAWLGAVRGEGENAGTAAATPFDLMRELSVREGNGGKMSKMRKFITIYSKFYHRPQLLAEGALFKLYNQYEKYNGLVDFIEKIPIKKPATVSALLDWGLTLEKLPKKNKVLFTEIYQSLFEILAFTGRYAPLGFDYDHLVGESIKLPLSVSPFYRGLFQFFKKDLGVRAQGKSLIDVLLTGFKYPTLNIAGSNYKYLIKDKFKKTLGDIIQSQEVCSFSTLLEINRLLERGLQAKPPNTAGIGTRITDIFHMLPHPGISDDAPRSIRNRIVAYSPSKLFKEVKGLVAKIHTGTDQSQLKALIAKIQGTYLVYQLKDHLMALAYAVNAKDAGLKAFLNPNLVRLHDINGGRGHSLWDNFGEDQKHRFYSEYHLSGGLSRLNITLAPKWKTHLFRENVIHNSNHVYAVILNLMDFYPLPLVDRCLAYNGLLVESGLQLMRLAGDDDIDNDALKKALKAEIGALTTGYHYKQTMAYLNGESNHHNLFISELKGLAEAFFHNRRLQKADNPGQIPGLQKLEAYLKPPLSDALEEEMHRFGSMYPYTFGNLRPRKISLFPQEMTNLFSSGWLSGERVDEFKVKLAYHLYKKKIPPELLGQLLYMYLNTTCRRFLRQNHGNDYFTSYLVFDIFNTSHLNRQIKQLKKEGYLKLK